MHVRTNEKLLMDIWWSNRRHLGVRALDIALTVVSILIRTSFVRFFSGPDSFIVIVTATDSSTFDDAVIYYVEIMRWMLHRWRRRSIQVAALYNTKVCFSTQTRSPLLQLLIRSPRRFLSIMHNSRIDEFWCASPFSKALGFTPIHFNVAYCMGVCSCVMIFTLM